MLEGTEEEGGEVSEEKKEEPRVSLFLSVILVLLLIVFIIFAGLILYKYYAQVQPLSPVEYDLQRWEAAVKRNPKDASAHMYLAWTHQQNKDYDKAEEEYKKALELSDSLDDARYQLGMVLVLQNKIPQAIAEFEFLVEKNQNNALSWYQLGIIRYDQEKYKEALVDFKNALRVEPTWANIHREIGKTYEAIGENEQAIEEYKAALQFLPDDTESIEGLKRLGAEE